MFGGSISGRVITEKNGAIRGAQIAVDGVNTTTADMKGVYYINFKSFPAEHVIEAYHQNFVFDPLTVRVTEETTKLPDIVSTATYICGHI